MLKWLSGEEGEPGSAGPGSPRGVAVGEVVGEEEMAERLSQTELLVAQLKELIREKDAALRSKDDRLKVEKESWESRLSKLRLQNKAKVTSLTSQLEELKQQGGGGGGGGGGTPTHSKKGSSDEHASRGKIVLLKKKVEELDQQLAQRREELEHKRKEAESQRQRGEEMDAMLAERDRKLAEKEAYIVHLQTAGDQPVSPAPPQEEAGAALQELQLLVQSLTRKVGEAEERYSLLQEQADSLKELLASEKEQFTQKESMYKQNIHTFKDIIIQKDQQLVEVSQMHEQELFKLAAKSDASADLEQLLKALKQKLHEKEEVLLGKTQVIDVLQGEVDGRDQQIKDLAERLHRLQVERESLASKMEAEKHVMRAQLRDLMEKQQAEVQRVTEQHQAQMERAQQDLLGQLEEQRRSSGGGAIPEASVQRMAELEARSKQKTEEAVRSEAKFMKMKAWSKSRIRQLEEELKKSQAGGAPPDLTALRGHITALEEEREENLWKVEQYEELKAKNGMLEAKLVVYEEQQRTLHADLEQFTKRAASQASESGSADDAQSQVLEWQEMVTEAASARDRAKEERAAMALRISHMEEEREELIEDDWFFPGCSDPALASRQQELEEELTQARGLGRRRAGELAAPVQCSLREDFGYDGRASFQDPRTPSESTTPMEGENMGGWWPEFSSPDSEGLRSVVEELELERNQLQEQILSLEERCQDLEDRLQLQARIEALQNESERLQSQVAGLRLQQSRDAENHQLLVGGLNEQLKGLSSTQECLESSLIEKENALAKTSERLQLIDGLRESLAERDLQCKDACEKLLQAEHALENVSKRCGSSEKRCSELKTEVVDVTQKLSALKEKTQKQEVAIETLQAELDQTNEELDKLNSAHLDERAQLIHDLQGCEREIDRLKDALLEKEEELQTLSGNVAEYAEQVAALTLEIKLKDENLVRVEAALSKAEREAAIIRESQTSDQQALVEKVKDAQAELLQAKEERESREAEVEHRTKRSEEDKMTIQELRGEIQKQLANHRNHLSESEALREQLTVSTQKQQQSEELLLRLKDNDASSEQLRLQLSEKEQTHERELKSVKDEQNGLLAQVQQYGSEVQALSKQLEEQTRREEHIRKEIQEKLDTIETLDNQRKATAEQVEAERRNRDSEKEKLSSELQSKSENVSRLKSLLKSTKTERKQLQDKVNGLTEELERQQQNVKELGEKVASALELNQRLENRVDVLTEEKERLKLDVAASAKALSGVTLERDSLQEKMSSLETQLSQSSAAIERLQRDKEDLTLRAHELNRVLDQSSNSSSEILLAKTNECSDLVQSLREREEEAERLQQDHRAQIEAQQNQLTQLQEALSLLREQEGSLKSELKEKETALAEEQEGNRSLQSEVALQKNTVVELRAEAASLAEEREETLKDATRQSQQHKEEVDAANNAAKALGERIRAAEENGRKLEAEAELRNGHVQAVTEQNHQLRAACESREQELALQARVQSDLRGQLTATLEQNASCSLKIGRLTESNERLQEELAHNRKSVSELTAERSSLREQNAGLEIQTSENQKMINGLLKEKEALASAGDKLKKILEEREQSNSALLLEKTSECASLSVALREREEQLEGQREQVGGLNTSLNERQNQLLQLQDTVSMLQEQGSVLKTALLVKEKERGVHREEAEALKALVAQMQSDVETLGKETQQREQTSRDLTDEFQKQKDAMSESAAESEVEMAGLKAAVQKLVAENCHLTQNEDRRKAEIDDANDNIQALTEQNARFKSELQKASGTQEEVGRLKMAVCDALSEREGLDLAMRGKEDSLKQQEHLIQQLTGRISEQEQQLKQRAHDNAGSSAKVVELQESIRELRGQVDGLSSESSVLKSTLEEKEQLSLEYQSRSSAAIEDLRSSLQAKEAECECLREQTSHLEEAVTELDGSLRVQTSEAEDLKKVLEEKEAALLDQSKSLQDVQRRADEASLFKTQFVESTESVSQLQSQIQLLSAESGDLKTSAEETQSAFSNLQEKYAANLEQLQDARKQLSQATGEASNLRRSLRDTGDERQAAIETLRNELSLLHHELERTQDLNSGLSKEKDDALASHQAGVSLLTVELERLKSQHLQVVAKMNALTENLEQREMALHAINSQYTSQAKHASQLVSEMQKLEEQNKRLSEEIGLSKEEHQRRLTAAGHENTHLQEQVRKHLSEREEQERRHLQELQVQMEQRSSSLSQVMQQTVSEKQSLQAKVSAKDQEVCRLQENIEKIEQVLQDSEKEWLLVLDREKQDKNLLAEQLKSVENEMKSKDVKVNALKGDLDRLQEKLAEASSAIRQGSDQLSSKESEASASRTQLQKVLESVQEKEKDNSSLQRALNAAEHELQRLVARTSGAEEPLESEGSAASLQDAIKRLQESHQSEVDALREELEGGAAQLQTARDTLNRAESSNSEKGRQVALLKETVERLQTRLDAEVKEAAVQHSAKDEQITRMSAQTAQQKELLAGLSQQLRDRDASIGQLIESASSERMKLGEERTSLSAQLESVEREHETSTKRLEGISLQLEERLSHSLSELQAKGSETLELIDQNEELKRELAEVAKERDAAKKKLQAALVVRKDLLKKIERHENQKEESVSLLQDELEGAQAAAEMNRENVSLLERKLLEKEGEILRLQTESERLVERLQSEKRTSQAACDEKDVCLSEAVRTLMEKSSLVEQLQAGAAGREEAFERDRNEWLRRSEELQKEIESRKEDSEGKSSSATADLENDLAQVKLEKAKMQKKAQAALLARKETLKKVQEKEKKSSQELAQLKDDYKALLEQRCQQTNELNEKVRELEELRERSLSDRDELVEQSDKTLRDLKMSLVEKEIQCRSLSNVQTELDDVKTRFESVRLEMTIRDEALAVEERRADALKSNLQVAESLLEKAHADLAEKEEAIQVAELKAQKEKQALLLELSVSQEHVHAHEDTCRLLVERNKAALEKSDRVKGELEALASQKALEAAETQQQLSHDKSLLSEELQEAQRRCSETQTELDSLKREKEISHRLIGGLEDELAALKEKVNEPQPIKREDGNEDFSCSSRTCAESFEAKLKERDDALSLSQAQASEREELISALELQLQHQSKMHESAVEKMRTEAAELQKSGDDDAKANDQAGHRKAALLTRRLQAALVSRKELLKENATLKEEAGKLTTERDAKEAECRSLEASALKLKRQNVELESSVSSLTNEKDELGREADGVFSENRSLSAACDSLKLTIESITQQKRAFSCQLESLKDSQTDELSTWKSKHAELKQDYESLLRAYENVSSEMDKMRQFLEGAKRDRQEALRKVHSREAEIEVLDERAREAEEENGRIKERMHKFSREKRQKIEELEEENQKTRKELAELEENHKPSDKDRQWEAETCRLGETLTELEAENNRLAEKLEEARRALEEKHWESNAYTNDMQLKLDEALTLNNSLTAQIEAQKTELRAQLEINKLFQKEKQNLCERFEKIQNDHELQLGKKDDAVKELKEVIDKRARESIGLNEKVRILEDDKSLLQEELENVQESSDKVKNENEYLETEILRNSERIDELTESAAALQTQNTQLSSQLVASKEMSGQVRQEKEEEQLKLVREFEEKLKTVQRGSEGSKNVKKELQELLREKHQEINHLQQNCIKYQEVILDFESAAKSSRSASEHSARELKKSLEQMSILEESRQLVEAELVAHKELLQQAAEKIQRVESERDQLALDIVQESNKAEDHNIKTLSPTIDEKQFNSYLEDQFMLQQQIEDLKDLKDEESQKVNELRQHSDSQDLEIATLKRSAVTAEAKLSALSATPQGAEASRRWSDLYQKTLHEKDSQLLEQGFVIKRFLEDMRLKDKEVSEFRLTKSRLERTVGEYSVAASAQQRQLFLLSASNAELSEAAELTAVQVRELGTHAQRLEQDKSALNRLLADKEGAMSQMQLTLQQVEKTSADADAQLLLLQSLNDRVHADFEKQEGIALQLKTLLHSKDAEISSLLSCRDGQMSGYLEQLQANHRAQVAVYEDRLASSRYQREKADKELRGLEAKVKNLQIKANRSIQEKEQEAAKMESFKNSMVSLQSERERLTSEYRILEAKSQLGLKGKDGSADGGATKGLKHEIRKLLHQMDDLNSENAMLRAQLVRYREDLNQVLFLKDNQLKVLLKKQQDVIKDLENQKAAAEKQHRESRSELRKEGEASGILRVETFQLKAQVSSLEADVSTLKQERAATNEGKVIADLREAVAAKSAECNDLQQKLLSQKVRTDELKERMQRVENETDKSLSEAEDKYNGELDAFEREVELMRDARETADLRAAKLAKELLEVEQRLSEATTRSRDSRAQSESMCGAMAALQNDRDQLIEDFKVLRNGYDEELREARAALNKVERSLRDAESDLAMSAKERDVLARTLAAAENKDAPAELSRLLEELSTELLAKEREAKRIALENDALGRQLSAFSRSMASLQNDRERLMDELAGAKRAVDSRQGSSPQTGESKGSGLHGLETRRKTGELQRSGKKTSSDRLGSSDLRSETEKKDALPIEGSVVLAGLSGADEAVSRLEAERIQLHGDLQRCRYEIQQRDQYFQQLNLKMQQAVEEKGAAAAQLRAISQTLRDSEDRCHWLEDQVQTQGSVFAEDAPGAPQERSNESTMAETAEASQLRERLLELEQNLTEERTRRETAEEALRLTEDAKSAGSRDGPRDFSIEMEPDEEWEGLSLTPSQPLITRKVKGGAAACRRWLRGRSLYFSRLLTGRARSRYFFLAYLLTLHLLLLMCLTGAL
ncbi:golgin subfamily B member 1-like isoform X2 [Cyclopterus lumpus]|uniref:golgin subfamily B member 1-like isoform X2 n=1 Tax=Cyclopterus lumpus TaxID=8103 RepID=UPI0014867207|nr:golgin subfamily B member 1-like isoform X2 [Cyclopterus lumpus]